VRIADSDRTSLHVREILSGWGDAATNIIEIAEGEAANAIAISRRGRGRLARLLLGSVSHKVVSLAPCVVIVVS
jgi:nucleotide-binding universal stress UspA family protein